MSDTEFEEFLDLLSHSGVKGMHWGVHKAPLTRSQQIADLNRRINKINGQTALDGLELRGGALMKQYKKAVKKDPNFTYGKSLNAQQKIDWNKRASRKVTRTVVRNGAIETAVIVAGLAGISKSNLGSKAKEGAIIGGILLAGQAGKTHISELHSLHVANELERLQAARDALGGHPK